MVNAPGGGATAFAPVNEAQRPGMVSYMNQGIDSVIRARREDADQKMHGACGGDYRIDAEGPQQSGGVVAPVGNSAVFVPSQYWFIQFSCVRAPAAVAHQ